MKAEYIDHMGSDLTVVNSARVSFDKQSDWEYITNGEISHRAGLKESDIKLINYLAKHNHWTPFSHVQITMRETVPIFVARQRFKHMVGFTYNEVSRRYVNDPPEFFTPDKWRLAPENAKQGSSVDAPWYQQEEINDLYSGFLEDCEYVYKKLISDGIAPEQARMVLPQSMYTSYYVTGSLAAWGRAYKLRIDAHAQKEIQDLAKQWNDVVTNIKELSNSWEAIKNN
jgi:thymidylate synthase (FAD)